MCSAYLLSVSLVELLDVLEREGFKTVKVNRNGNHNFWILHKDRHAEKFTQMNLRKHTIQFSNENYLFEEKSSNSSFGKFDKYSLSQFYKPYTKSEKSQTPPHMSLLGAGDYTSVFNTQYLPDEHLKMKNPLLMNEDRTDQSDDFNNQSLIKQKDFQNQVNSKDTLDLVDIGCQFNSSKISLDLISKCNDNEKGKIPDIIITDIDNLDEKSTEEKNVEFFDDKSVSGLNIVDNQIKSNKNLLIDSSKESIQLQYSKENILEVENDKTRDILDKLEKRFKNEHDYFSNVGIKKSNRNKFFKKCIKSMKSSYDSETVINIKDDSDKSENIFNKLKDNCKDNHQIESSNKLTFDDTKNYFKIASNLTLVESSESLNYYDALDTISEMSAQDSSKSLVNEKYKIKGIKSIDNDLMKDNIYSFKRSRYSDCLNNIKVKSVGYSKGVHVTYRQSNTENLKKANPISSKKVTQIDQTSCNKFARGSDDFEKTAHLKDDNGFEKLKVVHCFKNLKKLYHSKYPTHINSANSCTTDKKTKVDCLTPEIKLENFKKKLLISSNQQCSFKSRLLEHVERIPIDQRRIKFVTTFREKNNTEMSQKPIRTSKDIRELKLNSLRGNSMSAMANKERLSAIPVKHWKNLSPNRKIGNFRI